MLQSAYLPVSGQISNANIPNVTKYHKNTQNFAKKFKKTTRTII